MQIEPMERVVILGASRGLGAELVRRVAGAGYPLMGFGRKAAKMAELREEHPLFEYRVTDFSHSTGQDEALRYILETPPSKVFCVAGGGPFGPFHERAWKDHQWAWDVSFQFPARVAHGLRVAGVETQLIFVGSAVAETAADPLGASYCAAKHALKGLFLSLRAENPEWDIRLFSPGYLDTEMLPKNAAVRQKGVYNPAQVARELWDWSLTTVSADESGHRLYPVHPA